MCVFYKFIFVDLAFTNFIARMEMENDIHASTIILVCKLHCKKKRNRVFPKLVCKMAAKSFTLTEQKKKKNLVI